MPTLETINGTTYKIVNGRDEIEIGDINSVAELLGHMRYKRWHGLSEFSLAFNGTRDGLIQVDGPNGIIRIPYVGHTLELTAHDPDSDNPDGRLEMNVILEDEPMPDLEGNYWIELDLESTGMNWERIPGLDEQWDQAACIAEWGASTYTIAETSITRDSDGEVMKKRKPEDVRTLRARANKPNPVIKRDVGINKNTGLMIRHCTMSRDFVRIKRRNLVDARGAEIQIEDIQLENGKAKFKLPKTWVESRNKNKDYPISHACGVDPAYSEEMNGMAWPGSDNTWNNDWDIDANLGADDDALANTCAEIMIEHQTTNDYENYLIRPTDSSDTFNLSMPEAEGGGATHQRIFVQVDSGGLIDTYCYDVSDGYIYLIGYWENVVFTPVNESGNPPQTADDWIDIDGLSGISALNADTVYLILAMSQYEMASYVGARQGGSSIDRKILGHESENTSHGNTLGFITKTDANGDIEVYDDASGSSAYRVWGYFDSGVDFVELWQDITPGSSGFIETDLTSYIDEDGRVVDVLCGNSDTGSEQTIGAYENNGTARYFTEHEAEDDGTSTGEVTGFSISAQTDVDGKIRVGMSGTTPPSPSFYLTGYFKPASTGTTYNESASDGVEMSDSTSVIITHNPVAIDGAEMSDTPETQAALQAAVADGVEMSEALQAAITTILEATDGVELSEALDTVKSIEPVLTDGLEMTEALDLQKTANPAATDGAELSDTPESQASLQGQATDGIELSEDTETQASLEAPASDGVELSDTPTAHETIGEEATDGVELSDDSASELGSINVAATDGAELSDSPDSQASLQASAADGAELSEALDLQKTASPQATDGVEMSDDSESDTSIEQYVTDGVELSEAVSASIIMGIEVVDGLTLAEALVAILSADQNVSDGVEFSDLPETLQTVAVGSSDVVTLSEALSAILAAFPSISDGVVISDAAAEFLDIVLEATDGVSLSESLIASLEALLSAIDAVEMSDSGDNQITLSLSLADGVTVSEILSLIGEIIVAAEDSVELSEVVVQFGEITLSVFDGLSLSDISAFEEPLKTATLRLTQKGRSIRVTQKGRSIIVTVNP